MDTENNQLKTYDLIIVGAGPAGLAASIYASRYKIKHLLIGEALGGLAFEAHKICNFPTEKEISGPEIVKKMQEHMESLGGILLAGQVVDIVKKNKIFQITTQKGNIFLAETILLAIGTKRRRLDLLDEDRFIGKGISYCATCDAMFYRDKVVAVYGGADSANTASLYLAKIAKKVYQIYRKSKLRGDSIWIDQVVSNKKIEIIYNAEIIGVEGREKLENIILNISRQGRKKILVDGLFVEIGTIPQGVLIKNLNLETNESNYIKVDKSQKTNQEGIWAAGDVTTASNGLRQIITACSEGFIAAESIFRFLSRK